MSVSLSLREPYSSRVFEGGDIVDSFSELWPRAELVVPSMMV